MPIPSPLTMERLLAPYVPPHGLPVRVWGVEQPHAPRRERELLEGPKRFLCLGASDDGLVLVRQTGDTLEDLDGARFGWERVRRLAREPHLTKDFLDLEVDGRPSLRLAVSNHLLLHGNRTAARELIELAARHHEVPVDLDLPHHVGPAVVA